MTRCMIAPTAEGLLAEALADFSGELDLGQGRFWGLAFSRDGRRLAYATQIDPGCALVIADRAGSSERFVLADGELVSEVHGFCADGRWLVFSATSAAGAHEIRALDVATGVAKRLIAGHFFGGFDESRGGIVAWTRGTGSREELRIGFDGSREPRHRPRSDRGYVRSADGRRAFVADKVSADPDDKRFRIYETSSLWDADARLVAQIELPCRTSRVSLDVSPDGAWIHVSAVGSLGPWPTELVTFDRVIAADGGAAHEITPTAWIAGGRALLETESGEVSALSLGEGTRAPFLAGPVEHLAVAKNGKRVAYVRRGRLRVTDVRG